MLYYNGKRVTAYHNGKPMVIGLKMPEKPPSEPTVNSTLRYLNTFSLFKLGSKKLSEL